MRIRCLSCYCKKDASEFGPSKRLKSGLSVYCKWCDEFKKVQIESTGWVAHADRPERKCGVCAETKPLDNFRNDKKGINGKGHVCRACARVKAREYYAN